MKRTATLEIAAALRAVLDLTEPQLRALSEAAASTQPRPGQWSPKEILGHLIDSAGNNQQKFVRTCTAAPVHFPGYEQDAWVAAQHYQSAGWTSLVDLWLTFNRHLAHVMEHTPESALQNTISVDGNSPLSLEFIMADYVEHLKHHLLQILPGLPLSSRYN